MRRRRVRELERELAAERDSASLLLRVLSGDRAAQERLLAVLLQVRDEERPGLRVVEGDPS